MKNFIVTILTVLIFINGVYSQIEEEKLEKFEKGDSGLSLIDGDSSQQIGDIDRKRLEIKSNISSYLKSEKVKDSTGYRYVYSKGKELKLIAVYYKDQHVDKKVEWYFHNGQLIYAEQTWTEKITNNIVDYEKFYLHNEQLFAWIKSDNKSVDSGSKEFKGRSTELKSYAAKLKKESLK